MTSPIKAWSELYTLDQVRLPGDIDELAVICCESVTRTVSHIGIELENCIFNNSTLQQLRRRVAPGGQTKVQLRYNTALMDRIWVQDPVTLQRFEVLNKDPVTRDLSAKQVAALEHVRRISEATGTVITRAQARQRIEEIYRPMLNARNMGDRRRALKILGLTVNESPTEKSKKAVPKARPKAKSTSKDSAVAGQEANVVIQSSGVSVAPLASSPGASPPRFKVVRQGPARAPSSVSTGRGKDGNSH